MEGTATTLNHANEIISTDQPREKDSKHGPGWSEEKKESLTGEQDTIVQLSPSSLQ